MYRVKENSSNWRGGGKTLNCKWCGKEFYADRARCKKGDAKFCSQACKREYWGKHVSKRPSFVKNKLVGIKKQWSNAEYRKKMTQTALKTLHSYPRETSIERKMREWLETNEIRHECQHIINDKFCVDFYLPDYNIVIEMFGDYWHSNPLVYKDDTKLNPMQIKNRNMDKSRIAYLKKCGYSLFVIWEYDVNHNFDSAIQPLHSTIKRIA